MRLKESIFKIQSCAGLKELSLFVEDGVIYNTDIQRRYYIIIRDDEVIISDSLIEIKREHPITFDEHAKYFYRRYGFIVPPFTLYKGVFFLAPYVGISLVAPFTCVSRYPELVTEDNKKKHLRYDVQEDIENSLSKSDGNFQVLFSGGLDSSLLLAIAHKMQKAEVAINCFMASMPQESIRAQQMCLSKNIPFRKELVCNDLTGMARSFIDLTAEPVADKIALVIPAMLSGSNAKKTAAILDGQGADSLFSGLPQDKLYDLYRRAHCRYLGKLLGWLPVWKNKNTPLGRKLYRVTKVLHCLRAPDSVSMFIRSLVENDLVTLSPDNHLEKWLHKELHSNYIRLVDFHLVIRYFFMFRILPSREMQKYALSHSLGYVFKLPFLEQEIVSKYFYLSPSFSIKKHVYKFPITSVAKKHWPEYFTSSRTSPFQVEFETGGKSVSEFSLSYISDNK